MVGYLSPLGLWEFSDSGTATTELWMWPQRESSGSENYVRLLLRWTEANLCTQIICPCKRLPLVGRNSSKDDSSDDC